MASSALEYVSLLVTWVEDQGGVLGVLGIIHKVDQP